MKTNGLGLVWSGFVSYSSILSEAEFKAWKPNRIILPVLEAARRSLGLSREQFRVLDYGSGRGHMVLFLREAGYQAYGAEIDRTTIERGRDFLSSRGLQVDELIRPIPADFPEHSFHFVFSDQVFEHVRDLPDCARAMQRLTAPEAFQFHLYPGRWRVWEDHLGMPLVHWLPKGFLRRLGIWACTFCGVHASGWFRPGLNPVTKAETFYRYSIGETFYRSYGEVCRVFAGLGFQVQPFTTFPRGSWRELRQLHFGDCFLMMRQTDQPGDFFTAEQLRWIFEASCDAPVG